MIKEWGRKTWILVDFQHSFQVEAIEDRTASVYKKRHKQGATIHIPSSSANWNKTKKKRVHTHTHIEVKCIQEFNDMKK